MQLKKNPNGEDTVKDKESFECTQLSIMYRTAQISFEASSNNKPKGEWKEKISQ
jgi:hypothetical protein